MLKIKDEDWKKYINSLARISDEAAQRMQELMKKGDTLKGMLAIMGQAQRYASVYGEAAAALACELYDDIAIVQNAKVPPAEPARPITFQEVKDTVNSAMRRAPSTVPAETAKLVKKQATRTMRKNAARDGALMALVPSGDACAFCQMLASRGWESAGSSKSFEAHLHAHCRCEYVVRFNGDLEVEGYDPDAIYEEYMNADGFTWQDKMNAMRREQYAANKDAINAQKRAAYAARSGAGRQGNGNRPRLRLTAVAASTIIEKVKSGEYSLKLSRQQYDKHVSGTKEYVAYEAGRKKKGLNAQSRLTISYEEAQKIIEEKSGTGIIKVRKDGTPTNVEWITCDKVIGQYCHHGQFYETKKAMIIHGKKGSHIVPHKGNKYD